MFIRADLRDAHLEETDLSHAWLREADLRGAHLNAANLTAVKLDDADLRGADLSEASGLDNFLTHLKDARFDGETIWPAAFSKQDAIEAGALELIGEDPDFTFAGPRPLRLERRLDRTA